MAARVNRDTTTYTRRYDTDTSPYDTDTTRYDLDTISLTSDIGMIPISEALLSILKRNRLHLTFITRPVLYGVAVMTEMKSIAIEVGNRHKACSYVNNTSWDESTLASTIPKPAGMIPVPVSSQVCVARYNFAVLNCAVILGSLEAFYI